MKVFCLILSLLISALSIQAEEVIPNAHVVDLPAEVVTLPPSMAGQLALVRETVEVVEMLQTVLDAPGVYVNPQATVSGSTPKSVGTLLFESSAMYALY